MDLLSALRSGSSVFAAELRPPRAELATQRGHGRVDRHVSRGPAADARRARTCSSPTAPSARRRKTTCGTWSLNLGNDVPRDRIVPFLTSKHPTRVPPFIRRARAPERVQRARGARRRQERRRRRDASSTRGSSRKLLRDRDRTLALGGWANPHGDPDRQVDFLDGARFPRRVLPDADRQPSRPSSRWRASSRRRARRHLTLPGVFGVFYYRSANPRTLDALRAFLPVPTRGANEGIRRRRDRRRCLRAYHSRSDRRRREAFLYQQPADRTRTTGAHRDYGQSRSEHMKRLAIAFRRRHHRFRAARAAADAYPAAAVVHRTDHDAASTRRGASM